MDGEQDIGFLLNSILDLQPSVCVIYIRCIKNKCMFKHVWTILGWSTSSK